MSETGPEWRMIDGVAAAWFDARSLTEAAGFAGRVAEQLADVTVEARATGARVRLDSAERSGAVSSVARDLGLVADPAALQNVDVVIESDRPSDVRRFWQPVLGYAPEGDGLVDPLRRDPAMRIEPSAERRPLRNRVHLDVVRPADVVAQVGAGDAFGPYGVCHADPDGNEVDLVPGDPLGETDATADWQSVFGAVACYRTTSTAQQRDLVDAAAALADDAGFPLSIDVRPGLVILDTGKDRWHPDAHGLELDFTDLARDVQSAARGLGAIADPGLPRFVQLFLDAADVGAVRAFWIAALGYVPDGRDALTDIRDPRSLNPVLLFQELDVADTERRRQRNRIRFELHVPDDLADARRGAAVDAGGRLLDESDGRSRVADPEGNELVIVG